MAQLKTIVGVYCTSSFMTYNGQTVTIPKASVAGLMLYDPGSLNITLEKLNQVSAQLKSRRLILDNIDLNASQCFSPNLKEPTKSIPASPIGCTTCPIDKLPCYAENYQQPRERYVVARIVEGDGVPKGYRITQGFQVKEFSFEVIQEQVNKGTFVLSNAKIVNDHIDGKYAPIPEIELSRVQMENRMKASVNKAIHSPPLTMQEAQARGFIVYRGNQCEVKMPFLLNRGNNDIELITPFSQADMQSYTQRKRAESEKIQMRSPIVNQQGGRRVVRNY